MPYTYEKDKNGRWRVKGRASGSEAMPVTGGGFGSSKKPAQRKPKEEKPWWQHLTPAGIVNDLKYEAKRAAAFNRTQPKGRNVNPVVGRLLPIVPHLSPAARQVLAGSTVRAGADAALAAVNLAQRAWGNYTRTTNPFVRVAVGANPLMALPVLGLLGSARDPESTAAGKAIISAQRAATVALGARLPEEMSPSDKSVYEDLPANVAANVGLAFVPGMNVGRAIKGAGVAAKAARWGVNAMANEGASSFFTDSTMGGPSALLKMVGVPVPDALSADPTRDDRVSAAIREILPGMAIAAPLGAGAALLERAPHIARSIRDNRVAQDLRKARQRTVEGGLQEVDPITEQHGFTQTAKTAPPPQAPPAAPAPQPSQPKSILEQDADLLGMTPEELASRRGAPAPQPAPAPEAAPRPIPSRASDDFADFGGAREGGQLPQADPAFDPWTSAPLQKPAAEAVPAPEAAPAPAAPAAAAADDAADEFFDPELPEIDQVALALDRLDPDVLDEIAQTPGPVLPRIEEALASQQPVMPRPELTAADVTAPTDKLAENQFLTRRDEWANLRSDELLGVFHPEVNPGLFDVIHARTGRAFEELTRDDALETLTALADQGATVMPDRLKAGIELARTADLVADPARFQYKLNTDRRGVQRGNSLEGLDRWNTSMENTLLVWEDPATGKTYVVNGHNRLAKALELGIPTLPVRRLLASTAEQARALGAMDNIASGGGTPWDAAKFFRDAKIQDMGQAQKAGLPLRSGHAESGLQLAQLPDNIFQAGLTGELPEARALALGGSGLSPEKMQSVWKKYQEEKFFQSEENFQRLIDLARGTPTAAANGGGRVTQGEIPGFETAAERDLTVQKIKLVNKVRANLATDKRALKGASRNAGTLEAKGNSQIDAQTAMQAGIDAEQLGRVFDQLWWSPDNEVSALLNAGAAEIAAGAKADVVARRIQGELAQAAEKVMLPAKPVAPVAEVPAVEPPAPRTEMDREAAVMRVLNTAAAQGEVRPSATPIPEPPAPPQIDVARAARGIDAQDVMSGDEQLRFAQQQRQQALDAGDTKAVEAWDKEIRKVNQGRLGAAQDAQAASQTGLFGVTEYDNTMPLFDPKVAAEEQRLAAEYLERDTAVQQAQARAEREATGYHDKTFDEKVAEHGVADGWMPKTADETPDTRGQGRFFHGSAREIPGDMPTREYWTDTNIFGNGFYVTDDFHTAGNAYTKKGKRQALKPEVPIEWYGASTDLARFADATSEEAWNLTRATVNIPAPDRLRELASNLDEAIKRGGDNNGNMAQLAGRLRELADNPPKAKSYEPATYEAVEKAPVRFIDADRQIPWDEKSPEAKLLRSWKNKLWMAVKDEWEANGSMSYGEMMDEARAASRDLDYSRGAVTELFDSINEELESKLGFGGLKHQGGTRAGGGRRLHDVRVYWDPENQITLKRVGAEGPGAPAPQAGAGVKMPEDAGPAPLSSIASQEVAPSGKAQVSGEEAALRREFLTRLINKVAGDDVIIRYNDTYPLVQTPAAWGGTPGESSSLLGSYQPAQAPDFVGDVVVINGIAEGDLVKLTETAYHESWHRIQHVALGENEAKALDSKWARFKIALGSGHLLDSRKIAYGESQAVAVMRYATARRTGKDPVRYMLSEYQETDSKIWDLAHGFFSGVDRVLDFAEKMYNAFAGNGYVSTRSILEDFFQGNSINTYDYTAAPLDSWFGKTWDQQAVPTFDRFTALSSVLRDADNGKVKGVSKQALKLAGEGDARQALKEATDYARRRSAEIDAEIETIKRRAIEEGC